MSTQERANRAALVRETTHSIEMEGGVFSEAAMSDLRLYIDGTISGSELVRLTRERLGLDRS
ncbi:hypothetical protein FYJ32_04000 [Bifidobacterium tsurumiense]|nr:hypothetical protein [Bifidobacterium tsurumiense]